MQKQMSERDEELETVRKELQSMKVPKRGSEKGKNILLRRMSVSKKHGDFFWKT